PPVEAPSILLPPAHVTTTKPKSRPATGKVIVVSRLAIRLSKSEYERYEHGYCTIGALQGRRIVWKDNCYKGLSSAVTSKHIVYYMDADDNVVARRDDGRILWHRKDLRTSVGSTGVCAGGNTLLVGFDDGPAWGLMAEDPKYWQGSDGILGAV